MPSPKEFAFRMSQVAKNLGLGIDQLVKDVALEVHKQVVYETPVDTGRARSNWVLSVGFPHTSTLDAYVEYEKGSSPVPGMSETANAEAAIAQGKDAIAAYVGQSEIYISNNAPYINFINQGGGPSLREARPRFVELGIQKARKTLKSKKVLG